MSETSNKTTIPALTDVDSLTYRHASTFAELCTRVEAIEDVLAVFSFVINASEGGTLTDEGLKGIVYPMLDNPFKTRPGEAHSDQNGHETLSPSFVSAEAQLLDYATTLQAEADRIETMVAGLRVWVTEANRAEANA
jgi:hypothetical protein